MTREQYEAAKAAITAEYIKEMRKSIDIQFMAMQAMSESIALLHERMKRFEENKMRDGKGKLLFLHPEH